MLLTCQAGYESLFARELEELHRAVVKERGPGWVSLADAGGSSLAELALGELSFGHLSLRSPQACRGESVNALAANVADFFLQSVRQERIDHGWPNVWLGPAATAGLGRRISAVEGAFAELLKRKLSRVARLATAEMPRDIGPLRGLFVFFTDFNCAWVTREAFVHGPRRMADDPLAPSRSYLKVEEAFFVGGREPAAGETACDLGAAPGGWSYSAAKHGASVLALDNGPLKGGALDHPLIEHRREDAFKFSPEDGHRFDWLLCDLVEEPHHVLRRIVEPWLARQWCRRFVINLKFGRVDPIALLRELRGAESPFVRHARGVKLLHLYHDREEFTAVGETAA